MPWALGPPDGRYLLRRPGDPPETAPTHVVVIATLGAVQRRWRLAGSRRRERRPAPPQPEPALVSTCRATLIDVGAPLDRDGASAWLAKAGEPELGQGLEVLNRALYAFRLATADPYLGPVARGQVLVARIGFGAGERVAEGLWTEARELIDSTPRPRRLQVLQPQARLAALLNGRERALACEELALRARLDLDHGRYREAALQLLVALDAALAELASDRAAPAITVRLSELRDLREGVGRAAQAALAGQLDGPQLEAVGFALGRLEAALRARAVANA